MKNAYKGEVSLKIDGVDCTICFDWTAIAEIQTVFGKIITNIHTMAPDEIATALAIGLKKYNPDFTAERILALSPPILPIMAALDEALAYSYFGIEKKPKKATAEEKAEADANKSTKKKEFDHVAEAFELAMVVGIPNSEFWGMTPWQTSVVFDAYRKQRDIAHDHDAWMIYHGAILARVKKLPDLKTLLSSAFRKKPIKGINEHAIKERMNAIRKARKNASGKQ